MFKDNYLKLSKPNNMKQLKRIILFSLGVTLLVFVVLKYRFKAPLPVPVWHSSGFKFSYPVYSLRPTVSSISATEEAPEIEGLEDITTSDSRSVTSYSMSSVKSRLKSSEKVWQSYMKKLGIKINGHPENVDPWPRGEVMYLWDYFLPTFSCPHSIERVGRLGDGGKWVCGFELYETLNLSSSRPSSSNLDTVSSLLSQSSSSSETLIDGPSGDEETPTSDENCTIFSFGVAHESSFEEEILKRAPACHIYAYDASVNEVAGGLEKTFPSRVHFHKIYVGANESNTTLTLRKAMAEEGIGWIDILKMDIEANEFQVLGQIMDDFKDVPLPFGQLQLELHTNHQGDNFMEVYGLWTRLEAAGLRAFKNEINFWPIVRAKLRPIYIEYSFINVRGDHRIIR